MILLPAMKSGKISISQTGYALQNETLDHLRYKITNSKEYLVDYISEKLSKCKMASKSIVKDL